MRRYLSAVTACVVLLLSCGTATAWDASRKQQYPSPDMNTPNVDRLIIRGAGSTGDVSKMSAVPDASAPAGTLAKSLSDISGFKAPGASGFARLDAAYNVVNARSLFNSPLAGQPADWLGNGAGGGPSHYAYGSFGQAVSLSGLGDVGLVGATRTEDMTTPGRLPIGTMGWAFNFRTDASKFPLTSAWGGYFEARRKTGTGSAQAMEINVTELGSTDVATPSARGKPPNAVYNFSSVALNLASGGNCVPNADGCWDGTKIAYPTDASLALGIHGNGAKFKKGIIIGDDAITGCDGTGFPNVCTGVELGRGTDIGWIDGSTRIASLIRSDLSPSGNGLRLQFTDFGAILDGYGGATLNVVAKASDVNGVQIFGGGVASSPARIVAAGSPNASLGLAASGGGLVQMQSVMQLIPFTVATLPVCDTSRRGGMAYVTDAAGTLGYRNGVIGGGNQIVPVFCSGVGWEAH